MKTVGASRVVEDAHWMNAAGVPILGIVSLPGDAAVKQDIGVLVCVGGGQYRVGSHRQFVLLARELTASGYPTMRLDFRGRGDSSGAPRPFTDVGPDIDTAIDALRDRAEVSRIVLWSLCDAASAALIRVQTTHAVYGLVLVNPWVRSETTVADAQIRHYYPARLLSMVFWRKLLAGQVDVRNSMRSFIRNARIALFRSGPNRNEDGPEPPFQTQMAHGLRRFSGPVLLALSGSDLTAQEFIDYSRSDPAWTGLLDQPQITRASLPDADHTFSSAAWRAWLQDQTLQWLRHLSGDIHPESTQPRRASG